MKINTIDNLAYTNLCGPESYYDVTTYECVSCDDEELTLAVQQTYCSTCDSLLSAIDQSDFLYSIYTTKCIDDSDSDQVQEIIDELSGDTDGDSSSSDATTDSSGDSIIDEIIE